MNAVLDECRDLKEISFKPGEKLIHEGAAADRIWKAITHAPVELPGAPPIRVGCSVGGAILPGRAEDAESLVRAADEALLRAKEEGKNRIRFA